MLWRQLTGSNHHPSATRIAETHSLFMISMCIVGRDSIHHGKIKQCQPPGQNHIPASFQTGMSRISFIVNGWMTIVDLKKRFSPELHQLLGSDCPPKVWVIEMRHQHLASFLTPLQNHIQIVLHDIQDRVSTLWFQYLIQLGHVDVNWRGKIAVGNFLALQNQESVWLIEERRILAEGFQPDLQLSSILPALYPIGTKSSNILFISPDTSFVGKYI